MGTFAQKSLHTNVVMGNSSAHTSQSAAASSLGESKLDGIASHSTTLIAALPQTDTYCWTELGIGLLHDSSLFEQAGSPAVGDIVPEKLLVGLSGQGVTRSYLVKSKFMIKILNSTGAKPLKEGIRTRFE